MIIRRVQESERSCAPVCCGGTALLGQWAAASATGLSTHGREGVLSGQNGQAGLMSFASSLGIGATWSAADRARRPGGMGRLARRGAATLYGGGSARVAGDATRPFSAMYKVERAGPGFPNWPSACTTMIPRSWACHRMLPTRRRLPLTASSKRSDARERAHDSQISSLDESNTQTRDLRCDTVAPSATHHSWKSEVAGLN